MISAPQPACDDRLEPILPPPPEIVSPDSDVQFKVKLPGPAPVKDEKIASSCASQLTVWVLVKGPKVTVANDEIFWMPVVAERVKSGLAALRMLFRAARLLPQNRLDITVACTSWVCADELFKLSTADPAPLNCRATLVNVPSDVSNKPRSIDWLIPVGARRLEELKVTVAAFAPKAISPVAMTVARDLEG